MSGGKFYSYLKRYGVEAGLLIVLLLLVSFQSRQNGAMDPAVLIEAVVTEVIEDIGEHKQLYEQDSSQLYRMIDQRITPHFDFARITRLAMADHWDMASEAQKRALIDGFEALLVRTYARSLLDVPTDNPTSHFRIRSQQNVGSYTLIANLEVERTVGDPVALSLRMENRTGNWQVVDVVINGVSTVVTYRTQFDMKIREQGIEALIDTLQMKRSASNG